jgi:transcriptional regulator with XRE-family HTH domain
MGKRPDILDTPATRLRRARIARGYASASEAARAIGVQIPTYTGHENGTRGIGRARAEQYARVFGVKTSFLLMLADGPDGGSSAPTEADIQCKLDKLLAAVDGVQQQLDNISRRLDHIERRLGAKGER